MESWKGSLLPLDAKISGFCSPSYCFCFFLRLDLIIIADPSLFFVAGIRDNVTASEVPFCICYSSRLDHFSSRLQLQSQSFDSQTDPSIARTSPLTGEMPGDMGKGNSKKLGSWGLGRKRSQQGVRIQMSLAHDFLPLVWVGLVFLPLSPD